MHVSLLCGVRVGTITELVGRAGVGKSLLGLQLCIAAVHSKRGSIYFDTEQKLTSVHRLQEITREQWYQMATTTANGGSGPHVGMGECLESVHCVLELDSIAAPLQREFAREMAAHRATTLLQLSQILKRIAPQERNIAIAVINKLGHPK